MTSSERRFSSETTKFPDFDPSAAFREHLTIYEEDSTDVSQDRKHSASPSAWPRLNGSLHSERYAPRKESSYIRGNGQANGAPRGHNRQKSLSDAIRMIRTRKASVSANAQEIAEALKAPVSYKLVVCLLRPRQTFHSY